MPRQEIPGRGDTPYGGGRFDRPSGSFRPRTPEKKLLEYVSQGANIHAIIGAELENDAAILRQYNRDLYRGGPSKVLPLVEDMAELYGLTPDDNGGIATSDLLQNIVLVSGFSYLASHIYPRLVTASEQAQGDQLNILAADMMSASYDVWREFAGQVARDPFFSDLVSGEINRVLERDPSGVSWLQIATQAGLKNGHMELGTKKAIAGAGRLYKFLRPPVSRGS